MKRILITGANSYIGTSFEDYMRPYENYQIDTIDMIDGSWRNYDFSGYDTVFHVAGIAHSDVGKADDTVKEHYYKVNTELTVETAKKAQNSGVKQFVFMSSIIVYGSQNTCITKETEPCPDNFYGDSKLQADLGIHKLKDDTFNVVSIRPPMIYGKGSKGNYPRLAKLAKKILIFPNYANKRSMLYVENLCEFIKLIIDNNEAGYFYPQNEEYVNTSELVKTIANVCGKKIYLTKIFNPFIFALKNNAIVNKVFGDMYYDMEMSRYQSKYAVCGMKQSIERTEI